MFGDSALATVDGGSVVRDASSMINASSLIAGDTALAMGISGLVTRDATLQLVLEV